MEFASEMVVKSSLLNLKMTEIPTKLHPDGRSGSPHLNRWRDGWRHLVFLLIYSSKWLFLIPGISLFVICTILFSILVNQQVHFNNIGIDVHTMTFIGFGILLSYQLIIFSLISKIYSINQGLIPVNEKYLKIFNVFTLERGIIIGLILFIGGLFLALKLFFYWSDLNYGAIDDIGYTFRVLISSGVLIFMGLQTIFTSFLFRIIGIINKVKFKKNEEV